MEKQLMAKAKDIRIDNMVTVSPVTDNQKRAFQEYKNDKNLFLYGAAGTGKTFITLYLAMQEVLKNETKFDCVYIVRSAVPTREIGFLPGDEEDKTALFQVPYQNMVKFMFEQPNEQAFSMLYDRLKNQGSLMFLTTSFLRGITLDNAIIIVDEAQNLTFHELDTIITRVGMDSKIMFCGDFFQSDLQKSIDKAGMQHFMKILRGMDSFANIEFTLGDIVRSGMVKEYLISKIKTEGDE
jgi:predicted ribonuclease YlaK